MTRRRFAGAGVQYLAAGVNSRAQIIAGNQNWSTQIQGTDVELPLIRNWPTEVRQLLHRAGRRHRAEGRASSDRPSRTTSSARRRSRPGRSFAIKNQPFKVLGVMAPKGHIGFGQDQDDAVYAPYTTVQKKLQGIQHINNITVSAETPETAPVSAADHRAAAHAAQVDGQRSGRLHGAHAGRNGERPHGDDQDDDDAARRRSPACRCSSAASAS